MLKQEWHKLFSNKVMFLLLFAVALVPTLYTVVFLRSMWDPYGNIDKLPVALVNEDKSQEYEGRTIDVGNQLVEELLDDGSMDFHSVSKQRAQKGMKKGDYYMVITIPENFSENALSVLDEKPKKMELSYETNPGANYISSKMSESAMRSVNASLASKVTKEYADAILDMFGEVGDGLQKAADGSGEAKDGIKKLSDGNDTITENLGTLASSTLTFKDGMDELSLGINKYLDGASKIDDGAGKLSKGANTLASKTSSLSSGVTKLDNGANTLKNGISTYTNGVDTAYKTGSSVLVSNNQALNDGVATIGTSMTALKNGSTTLLAGLNTMSNTLKASLSDENKKQMTTLTSGLGQLNDGIQQLNTAVQGMDVSGLNTVTTAMTSVGGNVQSAANTLVTAGESVKTAGETNVKTAGGHIQAAGNKMGTAKANLEKTGNSLADASANVVGISQDMSKIATDLGKVLQDPSLSELQKKMLIKGAIDKIAATDETGVTGKILQYQKNALAEEASLKETGSNLLDVKSELESAGGDLTTAGANLKSAGDDLNSTGANLKSAGDTLTALKNSDSTAGLSKVGDLKTSVKKIADNSAVALPAAASTINKLSGGLGNVQTALDQTKATTGSTGLIEGMTTIDNGVQKLEAGVNDKQKGLVTSVATYTAGVSTLNDGLKKLDDNNEALVKGSSELAAGTGTIAKSTPALSKGIKQIKTGAKTLANGTDTLVANNGKLKDGTGKLTDGADKIADGSSKLHDGSKELGDGLVTLNDGVDELQTSLQDGADEVNDHTMTDDTSDMLSEPVDTEETFFTEIDNNGSAMAAYMMCVGLWVGGIAFCVIFPLLDKRQKVRSAFSWWFSRASVMWVVAIVQAIIMITLLMIINGLDPARLGELIGVAIIASLAFESIVVLLVTAFGVVGEYISLLLLILQLACCAGTYPIETSEAFFSFMNPFMPFTYVVHAFRATISSGPMEISNDIAVLIGIFAVMSIITLMFYQYKTYLIRNHKRARLSRLHAVFASLED